MLIVRSGPGEASRIEGGLRLSAAMLGMDYPQALVFVDEGVECLRPDVLGDAELRRYLEASADLAGVYVLSESLGDRGLEPSDLDPRLKAMPVNMSRLVEMASASGSVAVF
ncbi:hypothetical protein AC482_07030 [miscellaneous Crenarchaeota group-15 archaeon DG-45]|uniref:Uncharacterized protein n=1 Tax=miscellaneous Crenarchaeota group-15 archaeon DG-45 TaxID=1685127 RepID=A0A0M0BLL2_9ARCH|nr:MAG: hypothetical protein AC482_07030 [miscellaneous Crenarchaeota group-15 archaeon DG-45]